MFSVTKNICHQKDLNIPPFLSETRQDTTTVPSRNMWEIFKLTAIHASVIRFPEFAEFTEFPYYLRKTPMSGMGLEQMLHTIKAQ